MSQTNPLEEIKVESIFHPSDFSEASEVAFAHALRMALMAGSKTKMKYRLDQGPIGSLLPLSLVSPLNLMRGLDPDELK